MAVHGFSYLGALLTFIGVFGFLFFSFADLPNSVQPFVELGIPAIFFAWAWMLHRRGARLVSAAMALLGGMLLPLIMFASLVDEAPMPPDLTGTALIIGMVTVSLVLAVVYAAWCRRLSDSALRYLVGPLVWLAAMAAGFLFKTGEPLAGEAITRLVSYQPALASIAIAATLEWAGRHPNSRFARPTVVAAIPGVVIAYLLTLVLAISEGWTSAPLVITGAATFVSFERLGHELGQHDSIRLGRPILLGLTVLPLIPEWDIAWVGVLAVISYASLTEWELRSEDPNDNALMLAVGGAGLGLGASLAAAWPTIVAWAIASVWLHARRILGVPHDEAEPTLTVAAAATSAGLGYGLHQALSTDVAWLAMGLIAAMVLAVIRVTRSDDPYWRGWLVVAASVTSVGSFASWVDGGAGTPSLALITAAAVAAGIVVLSPGWPVLRVWLTGGATAIVLTLAIAALETPGDIQPAVWAVAGFATVIGAAIVHRDLSPHIAAIGHLVGLGALIGLGSEPARTVAIVAWVVAWLSTVVVQEAGRPSIGSLLASVLDAGDDDTPTRLGKAALALPAAILLVSIPVAAVTLSNMVDAFAEHRAWSAFVVAGVAATYAGTTRLLSGRPHIAGMAAVGAMLLSLAAVAIAIPAPWPSTTAAATTIAVALVLPAERSSNAFSWFAWIMSVVLSTLLADRAGIDFDQLHFVALGWGLVMLVGGLAFDDIRNGRRVAGEGLRVSWLRRPVAIGALVVPMAITPALAQSPVSLGWSTLAAAGGYAVVALQLRAGGVSAVAYTLATIGLVALSPWADLQRPVVLIIPTAVLVAISWLLESRKESAGAPLWLGWDRAPFVVAVGIGAMALARAIQVDAVPTTWLMFGVLAIVQAVKSRDRTWEEVGNLIVLVAALAVGAGWLPLALGATALRGVIGASFTDGRTRLAYQAIGVIAAGLGWLAVIEWQGWAPVPAANYSVVVFGGLAAVVGAAIRFRSPEEDSVIGWGALAVVGMFVSTVIVQVDVANLWPAAGSLLFAVGLGLAASRYDDYYLEFVSATIVGLAWLQVTRGAPLTDAQAVWATPLLAGVGAVSAAVLLRDERVTERWTMAWLGLSLVALVSVWTYMEMFAIGSVGPAIGIGLLTVSITLVARRLMPSLHFASPWLAGWAWLALVGGLGWDPERGLIASALLFGSLSVLVIEAIRISQRFSRPAPATPPSTVDIARMWWLLACVGVISTTLVTGMSNPGQPMWLATATGLALLAISSARGIEPLLWPHLRHGVLLVALGAVTTLGLGLALTPAAIATAVIVADIVLTISLLIENRRDASSPWLIPLMTAGAVAAGEVFLIGLTLLPERETLIAVVLALSMQAAAVGFSMRTPLVLALAPVLAMVGWLGIAISNLSGSAQWYSVPIALAMLAEVEILRWEPSEEGLEMPPEALLVLEWVGIGLLALAPVVEMFTRGPQFGLVALAAAGALLLWSILTRIRRRAVAAAVIAVSASVLMIAAAAANEAPTSALFWIVAAGIGFALMLSIALVEAYRSANGTVMARINELMEDWE
ncbi:MAG: hypothetical protein ABFR89_09900 [Actinomycetota bacterium]